MVSLKFRLLDIFISKDTLHYAFYMLYGHFRSLGPDNQPQKIPNKGFKKRVQNQQNLKGLFGFFELSF